MNRTATLLLAVVLVGAVAAGQSQPATSTAPASGPTTWPVAKFTVSKETTFFTKPLRPDGTVDYLAAINEHFSKGVTPENNAAVLLVKATGVNKNSPEDANAAFLKELGLRRKDMPKPFVPLRDYAKAMPEDELPPAKGDNSRVETLADQLDEARQVVWTAEKYPILRKWLDTNEGALALAIEASKRSRYCMPLVATTNQPGSLFANAYVGADGYTGVANLSSIRGMATAFCAWATLSADTITFEQRRANLLAVHRLARLLCQGKTSTEWLMGIGCEHAAISAETALATSGKLSAADALSLQTDLAALDSIPSAAEALMTERCSTLDGIAAFWRASPEAVNSLVQTKFAIALAPLYIWMRQSLEAGPSLREINRFYDRADAFLRTPAPQLVHAASDMGRHYEVDAVIGVEGLRRLEEAMKSGEPLSPDQCKSLSDDVKKHMLSQWVSPVSRLPELRYRRMVSLDMARVALALAAYRADTGKYPEFLADLEPKYMKEVPNDLFSGQPLIYKRAEKGYILYTVGPNGKDDGGKEDWNDGDHVIKCDS